MEATPPMHVVAVEISAASASINELELFLRVRDLVSGSECAVSRQARGRVALVAPTELIMESLLFRISQRLPIKTDPCYPLYLETITRSANGEGKEIRSSKTRDHYAHVRLTLEPLMRGEHSQFFNAIRDGAIPDEFIPAVQEGVSRGLNRGILKGFPVADVRSTVFDGSYHDIDSSDEAFEEAAFRAFQDGQRRAGPVLLEPIMKFQLRSPEDLISTVIEDLNKRRAWIRKAEPLSHGLLIEGLVPLSQVLGYHRILEELTDKRAQIILQPDHYAIVSGDDPPDAPAAVAVLG
jgi:elongation factor G